MLPLSAILWISFLGSALARPLALRLGQRAGWVLAILPASLFGLLWIAGSGLEGARAIVEEVAWVPSLGITLDLRLDGFSRLFGLMITGIGTLVTIYAGAYFADKPPHKGASFLALILLFMFAMLGTVLSDSLIGLYVFWELTSLVSFLLIGFDSYKASARKAALQSLIVTAGGGLALFAGILLIGMELGSFSLSNAMQNSAALAASPWCGTIMVLVLLGAFTKSAQVPFHFWLPNAMEAPTPASAYLHSATMVKLGVYLLARFDLAFAQVPAFGTALIVFGGLTVLVASVRALSRTGYKAVLAQSTVSSLGVLVLLIGLEGPVAATATVGFMLAHALYKATLFFCAGTAIHATGRTSLVEINGLRRALPVTAVAAALAAVAMAGLPPTFSFIAKEYLFEAQLESGSGWFALVALVLGSAVFVAIAGIVSLRPFFLGRSREGAVHHGETPGLFLGPAVLATLGLLLGLLPGLAVAPLLGPAASALVGQALPVSPALWHGVTPMLGLSALAVLLGLALYLLWPRLLARLAHLDWLDRLLGDAGYNHAFEGVLALARRCTLVLQNGDQRRYTATVVGATLLVTAVGLVLAAPPLAIDLSLEGLRLAPAVVVGLMVAAGFAATRMRSLPAALVAVGIVGFGSALLFLLNGAPDLAMTQFSVEALLVVILAALLLQLPIRPPSTRSAGERRVDALLAGGFGLVTFAALAAMTAAPLDLRLTEFFAARSYPEAFGRNVVNVILVDFRAIDTLGEIAVVAFAAMAVWGLLARRAKGKEPT